MMLANVSFYTVQLNRQPEAIVMRQDSHCYRPPSGNIIPLASDTTLPFGDWFHAVMRLTSVSHATVILVPIYAT